MRLSEMNESLRMQNSSFSNSSPSRKNNKVERETKPSAGTNEQIFKPAPSNTFEDFSAFGSSNVPASSAANNDFNMDFNDFVN